VSHVGRVAISVLVRDPLPLVGVGVTRPNVLGLQMLQLAVYVVSVTHDDYGTTHRYPINFELTTIDLQVQTSYSTWSVVIQ